MKKIKFAPNGQVYSGEEFIIIDELDSAIFFMNSHGGKDYVLTKDSCFKYEIIEDDMITGKEAKLAWANGEEVGYLADGDVWFVDKDTPLGVFDSFKSWKVKSQTITINNIEVPAPFEPKRYDEYWHIKSNGDGYGYAIFNSEKYDKDLTQFGAWRTEDEIKQVVVALRSIFSLA